MYSKWGTSNQLHCNKQGISADRREKKKKNESIGEACWRREYVRDMLEENSWESYAEKQNCVSVSNPATRSMWGGTLYNRKGREFCWRIVFMERHARGREGMGKGMLEMETNLKIV